MGTVCSIQSLRDDDNVAARRQSADKYDEINRQARQGLPEEVQRDNDETVPFQEVVRSASEVAGNQESPPQNGLPSDCYPSGGSEAVADVKASLPDVRLKDEGKSLPHSLKELPAYLQRVLSGHCLEELNSQPVHALTVFVHCYQQGLKSLFSELKSRLSEYCKRLGIQTNVLALGCVHSLWNFKVSDFESYIKHNEQDGLLHFHMIIIDERFQSHGIPDEIDAEHFTRVLEQTRSTEDKILLSDWFESDQTSNLSYHLKPTGKIVDDGTSNSDDLENTTRRRMREKARVLDILDSNLTEEQKKQYCHKHLSGILNVLLSLPRNIPADNVLLVCDSIIADGNDRVESTAGNSGKSDELHWSRYLIDRVSRESVMIISGLNETGNDQTMPEGWTETSQEIFQFLCHKIDEQVSAKNNVAQHFQENGLHIYAAVCHQIIPAFQFCKSNFKDSLTSVQNDVLKYIGSYFESVSDHVMVVNGVAGSGKTTLISNLVITMATSHPDWSVVCRMGGLACSWEELINSIMIQVALIYGHRPSCLPMTKENYSAVFSDVLNSLPSTSPLVIIIDGVDQCLHGDLSVDWIPNQIPNHVKVVLTSRNTGPLSDSLQKRIANEDCFLTLKSMTIEKCLEWRRDSFPGVTAFDELVSNLRENETPLPDLTPVVVILFSKLLYLFDKPNSIKFDTLTNLIFLYFDRLENVFSSKFVSPIMGYLYASRYGLTEMELVELLSHEEDIQKDSKPRYSTVDIINFWIFMQPFMERFFDNENVLLKLRPGVPIEIRERYYNPNKHSVHSHLVDYFRSVYSGLLTEVDESTPPSTKSKAKEVRIFQELPYHTFMICDRGKFLQDFVFNAKWFVHKCELLGVHSLLEDLILCNNNESKTPEVTRLQKAVQVSRHAISIDTNQLELQLQTRCNCSSDTTSADTLEVNMFETLIKDISTMNKSGLHTSSNALHKRDTSVIGHPDVLNENNVESDTCVTEYVQSLDTRSIVDGHVDGLVRIPSDANHVLGLSSTRGELYVWDINTMALKTKLANLDCPRNIKLFDSKRAAILCGRTVNIYDIESGEVVTKLKGVLNSTMPYFGIHDKQHVVALSRNRMYVNIMCTETGDMAATFKVGESRFLDSLLVSGNGEMLVCGDETQKPFPLLVWNLPQRKLVHDLRIQGHEFHTAISDISEDGHYVACVAKEVDSDGPNYIVVYDLLSGQLFKKLSPGFNTTCMCISNTRMSLIAGLSDQTVIEWGLLDGAVRQEISGLGGEPKSLSLSETGHRVASVNYFSVFTTVCLYDLNKGILLGTFTPDGVVSCCQLSANGNKLLMGVTGCDDIISVWPKTNTESDQS